MGKSKKQRNRESKLNKEQSFKDTKKKEFKENLIVSICLLIFIILIVILIYFLLQKNNNHIYEEASENKITNSVSNTSNELAKENGSFELLAGNIYIRGNVPKTIANKFYIECLSDGTINIYSKYTYNLSYAKYENIKGLILKIMIVKDDALKVVKDEEGDYTIIDKIDDFNIIYVIPKDIEYLEDDETSISNYTRLSSYREEIINSIKVSKEEISLDNTVN